MTATLQRAGPCEAFYSYCIQRFRTLWFQALCGRRPGGIATPVFDCFRTFFDRCGSLSIVFVSFCIVFALFVSAFSRRGATAVPRRHRDAAMAAWRRHSANQRFRQPEIPGALKQYIGSKDGSRDFGSMAACCDGATAITVETAAASRVSWYSKVRAKKKIGRHFRRRKRCFRRRERCSRCRKRHF